MVIKKTETPWILVTGGAKNLGAAISRELARQNYAVVIQYNHSEKEAFAIKEEGLRQGLRVECLQGSFSTLESTLQFIQNYLDKFPNTMHLINNVGNYVLGSCLNISLEQWYELFQTNLHTPYLLIRYLLPSLKQNQGSIINLGVAGAEASRADTYATSYTLTKTALLKLTKSLALELAKEQVRVNMVSPGYLEESVDQPKDLTKIPMQRLGTYKEVVDLILYLLSDQACYVTGQNIEIAGGTRL